MRDSAHDTTGGCAFERILGQGHVWRVREHGEWLVHDLPDEVLYLGLVDASGDLLAVFRARYLGCLALCWVRCVDNHSRGR